jgi:hypothetical protein
MKCNQNDLKNSKDFNPLCEEDAEVKEQLNLNNLRMRERIKNEQGMLKAKPEIKEEVKQEAKQPDKQEKE